MLENYTYTPAIWSSVSTAFLLLVLAVYSWRRRSVPGALPFFINCLLAVLLVAGKVMMSLAANDPTRLFWNRFENIWYLPAATAVTCFILEYAWPGRWLNRRNLILLSVVPLLGTLYLLTDNFFHLIPAEIRVGGTIGKSFGQVGAFLFLYSLILSGINSVVFVWLFIHSPQHRWPVMLMAAGQVITRILLLSSSPELESGLLSIPVFVFEYVAFAIALFGFRIFDPVRMARQTAIDQLQAGMLVLDQQGRIASVNPSAERILGMPASRARGKPVKDLLPAYSDAMSENPDETEIEFSLGAGKQQRCYTVTNSLMKDFRGLVVGRLLMLRDITEQKQAQAQIMEQQRVLATLNEREHMARDLHDSLGQVLGYASFQVEAAAKLSREGQGEVAAAQLDRLGGVIRGTHADVREYILNLHSAPGQQQPLFASLQQYLTGYTSNYDIQTCLMVDPALNEAVFSPEAQMQVFRIVQEALSNARKHGQARNVEVMFARENGLACAIIQDDGRGFVSEGGNVPGSQHFGLQFMRERAEELGGSMQIQSEPGTGTRVMFEIPIKER